jgi:polyhydroxyalkanoate synthesis regulator phasin
VVFLYVRGSLERLSITDAQREEIVRDRGMIRSQQTEIAGQRSRVEQLEARVARLEAVINRR